MSRIASRSLSFVCSSLLAAALAFALPACTGGSTDGGGGSGGSGGLECTEGGAADVLVTPFPFGYAVTVAGTDVYYLEPASGLSTQTFIRRVGVTGGTPETVFDSSDRLLSLYATDTELFFLRNDFDSGLSADHVHLYRAPRAAVVATQLGTGEFNGTMANIIQSDPIFGVFAVTATDAFVNQGNNLTRVSLSGGAVTVLAEEGGGHSSFLYARLAGDTVVATTIPTDTLSTRLFAVAADAAGPGGSLLGSQTCGSATSIWFFAGDDAYLCGAFGGLDRVDATGSSLSHPFSAGDLEGGPYAFNPSPIDGDVLYAMPAGYPEGGGPLFEVDLGAGTSTSVLCGVQAVRAVAMSATDLVWVELQGDNLGSATRSLRRYQR